ncbi:MAG: hypothetical protein R3Y47_09645 [Lachnospiraceae bacterium]
MKKRSGQLEMPLCVFAIIIVLVLLFQILNTLQFRLIRTTVEDGLVFSNLAAAVIDLEEYGKSNRIIISDTSKSYEIFKVSFKENMNLDTSFRPNNTVLFEDEVKIVCFMIYNVMGNDIEVITQNEAGSYSQFYGDSLGSLTAPNGRVIESTSIYSAITFEVEVFDGVFIEASGSKLIDVVEVE